MSEAGHNSGASKSELDGYIQRIERLEEEKREVADQIKEVKQEAKNRGHDVKALNEVLRLRRQDPEKAKAAEDMRQFYIDLLGVFG